MFILIKKRVFTMINKKIIAVIPAYEPPHAFIDYASKLLQGGVYRIVVVNDGSNEKYQDVFWHLHKLSSTLKFFESVFHPPLFYQAVQDVNAC